MKPTAVIHIGAEKTGSTSIQQFLSVNQHELRNLGFYVPTFLGKSNHRLFPFLAYSENRHDEFTIRNSYAPGSRRRKTASKSSIYNLKKLARRHAGSTWLISSEHIHSRLTTTSEISAFKEVLDQHFSSFFFVFYVRKPIDLAVSLFSTAIKDGHHMDDLPLPTHPYWGYLCNYKLSLSKWQSIFTNAIFKVRIFDKSQFVSGSLIHDYCSICKIQLNSAMVIPKQFNQSLSIDSLRFLNKLNKFRNSNNPTDIYSPQNTGKRLLPLFETIFPFENNAFVPSISQRFDYHSHFLESNHWIMSNFTDLDKQFWDESLDLSTGCSSSVSLDVSTDEEKLLLVILGLFTDQNVKTTSRPFFIMSTLLKLILNPRLLFRQFNSH